MTLQIFMFRRQQFERGRIEEAHGERSFVEIPGGIANSILDDTDQQRLVDRILCKVGSMFDAVQRCSVYFITTRT